MTDGLVGRTFVPPFYIYGRTRQLETRMLALPFLACSTCEYCEEA